MSALALLLVSQLTLGAAPGIAAAPQDVNEVIEAVGIDQRLDAELPLEAEFVDEVECQLREPGLRVGRQGPSEGDPGGGQDTGRG